MANYRLPQRNRNPSARAAALHQPLSPPSTQPRTSSSTRKRKATDQPRSRQRSGLEALAEAAAAHASEPEEEEPGKKAVERGEEEEGRRWWCLLSLRVRLMTRRINCRPLRSYWSRLKLLLPGGHDFTYGTQNVLQTTRQPTGFLDLPMEILDKIFAEVIATAHEDNTGPHHHLLDDVSKDIYGPPCKPFYLVDSTLTTLSVAFGPAFHKDYLLDAYCTGSQLTAHLEWLDGRRWTNGNPFYSTRTVNITYGTFELQPDLQKHVRSLKVGWTTTNCFGDERTNSADDVRQALEMIIEGCKLLVKLTIVESNQGVDHREQQREWLTRFVKRVADGNDREICLKWVSEPGDASS